jgi:hypothetical protein
MLTSYSQSLSVYLQHISSAEIKQPANQEKRTTEIPVKYNKFASLA